MDSENIKMDSRKIINELSKKTATQKRTYPTRENRYSRFGWNANSQSCYAAEDIALLQKIQVEYGKLRKDGNEKPYFTTELKKAWQDWWECEKPMLGGKVISYTDKSFTLPHRISKDAKAFPLWDFADRMAKQIANWQAERAANSSPELINDPAMLVFEELREWFVNVLAEKQGKPEDLQHITQRQSYINNLVHLLPDFGKDRLHLLEILHSDTHSLDDALSIIQTAIANRELPQLLTNTIIDAKSLENTIGTYMHFLGINEVVDDNFSPGCLSSSDVICKNSPVRKVFDTAKTAALITEQNQLVARYQKQHSLYALSTQNTNDGIIKVSPKLRTEAASTIKFASFVTENDKNKYIEILAILEALTNARKTLENFQNVQSSIGTYFFAYKFLDRTTKLANYYNALVIKTTNLLGELIHTSDSGLQEILSTNPEQRKNPDTHFMKNLRKLQTNVVGDSTLKNQLDSFSKKAIGSMNVYSAKMDELVADLKSGKASDDVKRAIQELGVQLDDLNNMLAAVLNGEQLTINLNQSGQCIDTPFTDECARKDLLITSGNNATIANLVEEPVNEIKIIAEVEKTAETLPDRFDKMVTTATHAAGYGVMRGATNVLENAMQSRGYSQTIANLASQTAYYSMYFASQFYAHYDSIQIQEPVQATFDAMQQAAVETGQAWIVATVLNHVGKYIESAGEVLEKNNWTYTGAGLKKLGSLAHFGMFAVAAATSDPVEAVVGFAVGTSAEIVTERVGNAMFV